MGLLRPHLFLLAEQSKHHPISGKVLVLGQQAVFATADEVRKIYIKAGTNVHDLPKGFDTQNKIPEWRNNWFRTYTNCQTALTMLGAESVHVADISDYEGADIIMDLNKPCEKKLHNQFDTIVDVGTLEHIFNIPQALENIQHLVRPGGSIVLINPSTNAINHGFYQFSPTLWLDYFSANGWEQFACYLIQVSSVNPEKKHTVYRMLDGQIGSDLALKSKRPMETAFFARKRADAGENTPIKIPIQGYYKSLFKKTSPTSKKSGVKNPVSYLLHVTRRWRPESLDKLRRKLSSQKQLKRIGEY